MDIFCQEIKALSNMAFFGLFLQKSNIVCRENKVKQNFYFK